MTLSVLAPAHPPQASPPRPRRDHADRRGLADHREISMVSQSVEPVQAGRAPRPPARRGRDRNIRRQYGRLVRYALAEGEVETPLVTVADLFGCEHAAALGWLGKLTPEQERRLIEAALAAYEGRRRRRFPRSDTGSETGSEF